MRGEHEGRGRGREHEGEGEHSREQGRVEVTERDHVLSTVDNNACRQIG